MPMMHGEVVFKAKIVINESLESHEVSTLAKVVRAAIERQITPNGILSDEFFSLDLTGDIK